MHIRNPLTDQDAGLVTGISAGERDERARATTAAADDVDLRARKIKLVSGVVDQFPVTLGSAFDLT